MKTDFSVSGVGDILRAAIVLLCMFALLLSHILLANQFFVKPLQLVRHCRSFGLQVMEVRGVKFFRLAHGTT